MSLYANVGADFAAAVEDVDAGERWMRSLHALFASTHNMLTDLKIDHRNLRYGNAGISFETDMSEETVRALLTGSGWGIGDFMTDFDYGCPVNIVTLVWEGGAA